MHRADFFEILLQTITDGTIIIDTSMTIVYHNKAIANMLDLEGQELVGQPASEFFHHFDGADLMPYNPATLSLQEVLDSGAEKKPEVMALRKPNGQRVWYRMTTDPICRTDPNTVDYLVAIFSNINDLMDKTFELEANRQSFADLVENVPGVIYQWAEHADGNYGFTYVSRKMKDYFGLEPEDMNRFSELMTEDDRLAWRKSIEDSNATGQPWTHEGRLHYPDGSEKWWRGLSISSAVNPGQRVYNGLLLDITAQRRIQEQLETLNAELQQFAFVASHDLQEPLRKIFSFLDLFKMQYFDQVDEEGRRYIEKALEASVRMRSLITDLLEYSRLNREKETVETDTREVALEVAENFAGKDIEIEINDLPTIKSLEGQLYRVFQNLFSNGLKYNQSSPKKLKVSARKVGNEWEFTVQDNGIGIDPESHTEIFTPFKRLHGKNTYSGTGLGLAICQKIVMMHGGRFLVESNRDKGSKFIFTIPDNFQGLKKHHQFMDLKIKDKHFIVCGAGKGLGEAVAAALLNEGAFVTGVTRSEGSMQNLEETFPDTFNAIYADIYDNATHQRLLQEFENKELAGVVFNAGGPPATSALETTSEQWDEAYRTVFRWKVELTTLLLPKLMKQQSGRLLFLESISVKQPAANLVLSNAMRSAVISWMKTLSNEIGAAGIACNAIATGFHATGAMDRVFKKAAETSGSTLEEARKNLENQVPAKRLGTSEDFGSLTAWLLSAHSGYLTGQTISIDGGLVKGLFG